MTGINFLHEDSGAYPEGRLRSEGSGSGCTPACLALKMRWKVSARMMMMQAKRFGLIRDEAVTRLHINYARRGYLSRGEPNDDEIPAERPRLLQRALEVWVSERSPDEVRASLPFGMRDVLSLSGVGRGVLTGETARVIEFIPAEREKDEPPPSSPGSVVHLRTRE